MTVQCAATRPAPLRCPTLEESMMATLRLLPRGRVWPANDEGMFARYRQWVPTVSRTVRPEDVPFGFGQTGFFAAIGEVRNFVERRLCDLRAEFWCATRAETDDLWMAEYGLPDDCDPNPDLCAKVAAQGGATCEYYVAAAERIGWSIGCSTVISDCGDVAGCSYAGNAIAGSIRRSAILRIDVDIAKSPAYVAGYDGLAFAGCAQAGGSLSCFPDITSLICLLERIVHAHVEISYNIIPPPTYLMTDADTHLAADDGALLIAN